MSFTSLKFKLKQIFEMGPRDPRGVEPCPLNYWTMSSPFPHPPESRPGHWSSRPPLRTREPPAKAYKSATSAGKSAAPAGKSAPRRDRPPADAVATGKSAISADLWPKPAGFQR